jgi:uncharacterized Zn finger protein (UPF0148 family)
MTDWINIFDLESTLGHKILIAGLKEAGKTAIKKIFFLKQKTVDVKNLKATINYERMAIKVSGTPITVVDLGGQKIFIKRFLDKFSPFIFNGVRILLFVIDVSEKTAMNNALQYFRSCLDKIEEFSPETDIYVFLHKNDLIKNIPNYESINNQLKEQFQFVSTIRIKFFTTSIFEPSTVINAFGRIFELSIPSAAKSKLVEGRIIGQGEKYAEKYAISEISTALCPSCKINLVETPEGLICSICGHSEIKRKDKVTEKQEVRNDLIRKLESQLQEIIVTKNEVEGTPKIEKMVYSLNEFQKRPEKKEDFIKELINNYGITEEGSVTIVEEGFYDIFKLSMKFGARKDLLNKIFFDYLPKIDVSEQDISKNILFGIVSAFLNGVIAENEIFGLIQKSIYFSSLSIDELIWNNFPVIDPFRSESQESVEEIEEQEIADEKVIFLSCDNTLGFKIVPKEYNIDLSFFKDKIKVSKVTIPLDINEVDLTYLFSFELNIPVKSNFKEFVKESVTIVSSEIKKIKLQEKISPQIIQPVKTEIEKLNKDFDVYYKIKISDSIFEIDFLKQKKNFGNISGPLSITAPEMFHKIKNKTLISTVIPDDTLMFSILDLYNKFEVLTKKI